MNTQLFSIVRFVPEGNSTPVKKIIISSGMTEKNATAELMSIRCQRQTYHNEHCTEIENEVFNVCSHNSNGGDILMCYHLVRE